MLVRLRIVGAGLIVAGLVVVVGGVAYGYPQAADGLASAQAMYEAQGVTLSYNEEGQLIDRGTPAGARLIMDLLERDFAFPVNHANFDPDDPIVNTRDELMYQYAVITYHVLNGTVAVELREDDVPITYRGVTYTQAGTYDIKVQKYYAQFDRTHPIEGPLRDAWSPLAISLVASLAGAHANQATGELALATTLGLAGLGAVVVAAGVGMLWVGFAPVLPAVGSRPLPEAEAGRRVDAPLREGAVARRIDDAEKEGSEERREGPAIVVGRRR